MPLTYRVTSYFSGRSQGWSEAYVYPGSDSSTPAIMYTTVFQNIAQLRAELLSREYTLDFVRVAQIYDAAGAVVKRVSVLNNPEYTPTLQTAANAGETPNACALITFFNALTTRKKKTFLGGVPDAIFTNAGVWVPGGAGNWQSRFNAWVGAQIGASVGWLKDVPLAPQRMISGITDEANETHVYTTTGNLFQVGDVGQFRNVRVKQVNGRSVYNGAFTVVVNTQNTFTPTRVFAAGGYLRGGVATAYTFPKPVEPAATVSVEREGTHKRGRPFVATRGRLAVIARV